MPYDEDYEKEARGMYEPSCELQNCLAEAMPYAVALRGEIKVEGEGPVEIMVREPVFCKATDGFAGMMTVKIVKMADEIAAREYLKKKQEEDPQGETEYRCEALRAMQPAGPVTQSQKKEDPEEIPF